MITKKEYKVGDSVWIHGIQRDNKLIKGEVVKKFVIDLPNWGDQYYYVISIPTHIESLLEIRQWENISQDQEGPIGMYRELGSSKKIIDKFMTKIGYSSYEDSEEIDEPTPEQIHAALEKSQKTSKHTPLLIKTERPKRKFYNRKKKQ